MNIAEFCASRNLKHARVANYIKRHPELFKDHTHRHKNSVELDDVALVHLDKKYPLPSPIQVVEDAQLLRELLATQKQLIQLQEENKTLHHYKYALEQKEAEFEALKGDLDEARAEIERYRPTIFGLFRKVKSDQ